MKVLLANPRGFCAGVNMAIECLDEAIRRVGAGIYVYHEIVHNKYVVDRFTKQGVKFVNSLDEVPIGGILLFSAHGVSPEIRMIARERKLQTVDATCPLVTKVHLEAIRYANQGFNILLIGHEGHDEVIGTMGEAPESITLVETPEEVAKLPFTTSDKLAYLTQTTLSVDEATAVIKALRSRYPQIDSPKKEDICYATTNRQDAVKALVESADVLIVLGSQNSSNSRRLMEIGASRGVPSYLVDGAGELRRDWFEEAETVVVTAGASAPEVVVRECIEFLQTNFSADVSEENPPRRTRTFRDTSGADDTEACCELIVAWQLLSSDGGQRDFHSLATAATVIQSLSRELSLAEDHCSESVRCVNWRLFGMIQWFPRMSQ